MITVLVGVLAKILREGIESLIERIRILVEETEPAVRALRQLPETLFEELLLANLERLEKEDWIALGFLVLVVVFIVWTLKAGRGRR